MSGLRLAGRAWKGTLSRLRARSLDRIWCLPRRQRPRRAYFAPQEATHPSLARSTKYCTMKERHIGFFLGKGGGAANARRRCRRRRRHFRRPLVCCAAFAVAYHLLIATMTPSWCADDPLADLKQTLHQKIETLETLFKAEAREGSEEGKNKPKALRSTPPDVQGRTGSASPPCCLPTALPAQDPAKKLASLAFKDEKLTKYLIAAGGLAQHLALEAVGCLRVAVSSASSEAAGEVIRQSAILVASQLVVRLLAIPGAVRVGDDIWQGLLQFQSNFVILQNSWFLETAIMVFRSSLEEGISISPLTPEKAREGLLIHCAYEHLLHTIQDTEELKRQEAAKGVNDKIVARLTSSSFTEQNEPGSLNESWAVSILIDLLAQDVQGDALLIKAASLDLHLRASRYLTQWMGEQDRAVQTVQHVAQAFKRLGDARPPSYGDDASPDITKTLFTFPSQKLWNFLSKCQTGERWVAQETFGGGALDDLTGRRKAAFYFISHLQQWTQALIQFECPDFAEGGKEASFFAMFKRFLAVDAFYGLLEVERFLRCQPTRSRRTDSALGKLDKLCKKVKTALLSDQGSGDWTSCLTKLDDFRRHTQEKLWQMGVLSDVPLPASFDGSLPAPRQPGPTRIHIPLATPSNREWPLAAAAEAADPAPATGPRRKARAPSEVVKQRRKSLRRAVARNVRRGSDNSSKPRVPPPAPPVLNSQCHGTPPADVVERARGWKAPVKTTGGVVSTETVDLSALVSPPPAGSVVVGEGGNGLVEAPARAASADTASAPLTVSVLSPEGRSDGGAAVLAGEESTTTPRWSSAAAALAVSMGAAATVLTLLAVFLLCALLTRHDASRKKRRLARGVRSARRRQRLVMGGQRVRGGECDDMMKTTTTTSPDCRLRSPLPPRLGG